MNIGGVHIEDDAHLAPMAGVTDYTFRNICKEFGCAYMTSEMVSAKAILYNNKNTGPLLRVSDMEHPIALQLFGSEPDIMAEITKRMCELHFDIIDVNMGCPVPKIVNNHEGSALMKEPKLVGQIVEAMVKASTKPITVKIRAGFDSDSINAPEIAHIVKESGGAAVTVHARTRSQFYSGKADWSVIRAVKERVGDFPVIGNGDVASVEDFIRMKEETGCDGVAIGRAAKGNPWIFSQIKNYNKTGEVLLKPSPSDIRKLMQRHLHMIIEDKGEYTGIREMRKHIAWYTSGLRKASALRDAVNHAETADELMRLIEGLTEE